ncbi:MAG: low temperature requirement protein A [Acidimicrobiales bacterium]
MVARRRVVPRDERPPCGTRSASACCSCCGSRLALPQAASLPSFLLLATAELAVPIWAERAGATSWHPDHIAERYGLFTIIVLGESLLAATIGVQAAWDADVTLGALAPTVVGGLLTVFAMWWSYFAVRAGEVTTAARESYLASGRGVLAWGYGHYVVFASAAAVGAGLDVAVGHLASDHGAAEPGALTSTGVGLAVTIPVAVYVLAVWLLHAPRSPGHPVRQWAVPITVALILGASFTPQPVLLTGVLMVVLVAIGLVGQEHPTLASSRAQS